MNEVDKLYTYMNSIMKNLYDKGVIRSLNLKDNIKFLNNNIESKRVENLWAFKSKFR